MPSLEIIASSLEDAIAATEGGADSLELCIALEQDGLTPPLDLVQRIRAVTPLKLNILVRPHARDFIYTAQEVEAMAAYIQALKALTIHTIVFGALTPFGTIDNALLQRFVELAAPIPLTLHRAIDVSTNPDVALANLPDGIVRVLTSGCGATAWDGRKKLKQWIRSYPHLNFALASGITHESLAHLIQNVGASEYHVGRAARENDKVSQEKVRQLKSTLDSFAK